MNDSENSFHKGHNSENKPVWIGLVVKPLGGNEVKILI